MPGEIVKKAVLAALALICAFGPAFAQTQPAKPVDMTKETQSISTPNALNTRIGPLQFNHGRPSPKTAEQLYDHLDFVRAVDVFLNALPGASLAAMRRGQRSMGAADNSFVMFEHYLDFEDLGAHRQHRKHLCFGLPRSFRRSAGAGISATRAGRHRRHVVPPRRRLRHDRAGQGQGREIPDRAAGLQGPGAVRLPRRAPAHQRRLGDHPGLAEGGDVSQAAMQLLSQLKVYPLAQADAPPATEFVNGSGNAANTVPANDVSFFEDVDNLVQAEPVDALDPELTGQLAAIGIVKGKPFNPDARMKRILTEAAAVGGATARAILFKPRDPAAYLYPDSAWITPLMGGGHLFMRSGARLLDARVAFHYGFTVVTPSMLANAPGAGQQYAVAAVGSGGEWLDGGKLYRLQLPPNLPAKESWSVTLYDPQTRSLLQTENLQPVIGSQTGKLKSNADGSIDLWFGPKAPTGKEDNWLRTAPGKGWFAILRLNAPLKPWFDKSWRPGEFEEMR